MQRTTWQLLEDAVASMPQPFSRDEILSWFRRHHPDVNQGTVSAHIQFATSNAPVASRGAFAHRTPLLTRLARSQYVRYQPGIGTSEAPRAASAPVVPAPSTAAPGRDVVLAGGVQLVELLAGLAAERPVFHSEADLQHALAWHAHAAAPTLRVRLETRPIVGIRLDLALTEPDGAHTAIELKYMQALWSGEHDGELFALRSHGAQDITCYDIVKDIGRVERLVQARPGSNGVVIALTNDASYWRAPIHGRITNADAFRIHEGRRLAGSRAWGPATGHGTLKGREEAIVLRGDYAMHWAPYSAVGGSNGEFRLLVVEVPSVF